MIKPFKEHSRGCTEFPYQNCTQIGRGVPELRSDIQTSKQRLLLYMKRYVIKFPLLLCNWINMIHPSYASCWQYNELRITKFN